MPDSPAKKRKIALEDARKVSGATGLPINKPRTGEYDYEVISNIIRAAKDEGVDPYTAIAIGLQESNLGEFENLGQVEYDKLKSNPERYKQFEAAIAKGDDDVYKDARGLAFMLKASGQDADKAGYQKSDEAQRLQAYNGYGKVGGNNDVGAKTLYGIDLTKNTIDMRKTPLYGKTIVDVRDNIIKKNPEIQSMVDAFNISDDEMKTLTVDTVQPKGGGKTKYVFKQNEAVVGEQEDDPPEFKTKAARAAYFRTLYLKTKQAKAKESFAALQRIGQK